MAPSDLYKALERIICVITFPKIIKMKQKGCLKLFLIVAVLFAFYANAQDPKRFQKEVDILAAQEYNFNNVKKLALFTGSSSIRMWNDLQSVYPEYNVINNGFGGSHFSDLIFYYDKLIAPHDPDILFVYEGDNDIASGKKPKTIVREAKHLIGMIRRDLPRTKIVLISPKPSIARWNLKKEYKNLNSQLEKLANRTHMVEFANVWQAMVNENGEVYKDIFIDDNLHLNEKGYGIWEQVIGRHLEQ
jgi:lysophospholipase L1-like esterase